ncbi:bifunctional 3-demethylubiquinone-9 3-methyltransferase/ 2-octaprenyl-6-hydroxy phenol methylase [Thalassoglobus neptunius]|uniref:Bifunctional 3-demethylubiquinone-9 3-methyltransferase/ 2-octaprenyl-6-hydroxy phenol methylase n=1 Tax=Thalassoglobus neptunius TaxID=1938619 RepID=A0A5C5X3V1_9PLAN|nr:class I SAM-dependent methyltransferase [Thalassoglobus neptunius]TWT57540.1 bifunctional 3-demethylubiquinone-9 3-methyltransferase/ 2-octaprenyl-6-hydroxy phenol methylase [Thalassoglobus neptunius]
MNVAKSSSPLEGAQEEIDQGRRFAFGKNWAEFLSSLDENRIEIAEQSLRDLLQVQTLENRSFLDVGSGSGLFSLCARRLGATVHSFDFDPNSVACTQSLKDRYFPDDDRWVIESGSVLDSGYLSRLGQFDFVYSWGVLHHTGEMWQALENIISLTRVDGFLAIAIYNDQGWQSDLWRKVKQIYCSGSVGRYSMQAIFFPYFCIRTILVSIIRRKNAFREYRRNRGMSIVHDWRDWLGGYPFEVASVEAISEFYEQRGFNVVSVKATKRLGCNEFLLQRVSDTLSS